MYRANSSETDISNCFYWVFKQTIKIQRNP